MDRANARRLCISAWDRHSEMLSRVIRRAAFVVLLAGVVSVSLSAEVIDRIVAVVAGQIVTQSDVTAFTSLGLAGSLDDLIDRALELNEVRRVAPPEPATAAIEARMARIRARFPSTDALARALSAAGLDETALRVYAADDLRLASYLDERFSSAAQPGDEEVRQSVLEHPELTADEARLRLSSERRQTLVTAWVSELRRRADVVIVR